jgi:type IV pilus assembly protein PilP
MPMLFKRSCNVILLFLLISFFLWNCGDQKEDSKATVVSKKISVQKLPQPRIYDPKVRLNPFIPLFRSDNKESVADKPSDKKKRKKRVPQTPLERISINQLKLVAVLRASSGNRGLVEDNSGKGYIIKNGTYIGLNSGIVTQINANNVIVEEELENLMGELILQNTEIKLQKPAGE